MEIRVVNAAVMGNGDVVFNDDRAVSSDGTLGAETNITAKFRKDSGLLAPMTTLTLLRKGPFHRMVPDS